MLAHAVDYGPDGPVDYDASHLWITHAVDFPALRARAHISARWGVLWITLRCGLVD